HENGLGRRDVQEPAEACPSRDGPEVERLARGPQPAAPHVVGEGRHGELLRDLRLADEGARTVAPHEVPFTHQVVERRAHRETRDSEVHTQLALGRDSFSDRELLDEVEDEIARRCLLRHPKHRNGASGLVKTTESRGYNAAWEASGRAGACSAAP